MSDASAPPDAQSGFFLSSLVSSSHLPERVVFYGISYTHFPIGFYSTIELNCEHDGFDGYQEIRSCRCSGASAPSPAPASCRKPLLSQNDTHLEELPSEHHISKYHINKKSSPRIQPLPQGNRPCPCCHCKLHIPDRNTRNRMCKKGQGRFRYERHGCRGTGAG